MKRAHVLSIPFILVASLSFAELRFDVKNVEAHQRYPWNGKVDIDFLIESSVSNADFKLSVSCLDIVGNTNLTMRTVRDHDKGEATTNFMLKAGQQCLTWDADIDLPDVVLPRISIDLTTEIEVVEYLVIDLSEGPDAESYPVFKCIGFPIGGWTAEHKSTKLVLRRCPAGADPLGRYSLTKDFYAGVFEVTEKQWELVMGSNPSYAPKGDTYPVNKVSYADIRGASEGANWPSSSAVDATSFLGKLRGKTELASLDLPTEAQWEYACRAGTTTTYNIGDTEADLAAAGWYGGNADGQHPVGEKVANAWGLYDMHGNVMEWCLDLFLYGYSMSGQDPVGGEFGVSRHARGGSSGVKANRATSSYSEDFFPENSYGYVGLRLFMTIP